MIEELSGVVCPTCHGTGVEIYSPGSPLEEAGPCSQCEGYGEIPRPRTTELFPEDPAECPTCGERGPHLRKDLNATGEYGFRINYTREHPSPVHLYVRDGVLYCYFHPEEGEAGD